VVDLAIPGLVCLVGRRDLYVPLFHPCGGRFRKRYMEYKLPDPKRPWRKHPDFAYGWEDFGLPLLVVEVFGFGKYHTIPEALYLKREYARVGVLCLVFSDGICRRDPSVVGRRIRNAIRAVVNGFSVVQYAHPLK